MIPRVYVVGPQYLYQRAKVSRNHQLLVAACHDLRCKAIIFDKCIISDNYISGEVHQGVFLYVEEDEPVGNKHCTMQK